MSIEKTRLIEELQEAAFAASGKQDEDAARTVLWIDGPRWNSRTWPDPAHITADALSDDDIMLAGILEQLEQRTVYSAEWAMGMVGGGSRINAYDLENGSHAMFQFEDAGDWYEWFIAIVPGALLTSTIETLQVGFLLEHEGFGFQSPPNEITAIDFTTPAILRAAVSRTLKDDDGWSAKEKLVEIPEMLNSLECGARIYGPKISDDMFRQRLQTYWVATVRTDSTADSTIPPGMDAIDEEAEFLNWTTTNPIYWKDSDVALSSTESRALRITCQYLALVDQSLKI